jgi:hypothetical protein
MRSPTVTVARMSEWVEDCADISDARICDVFSGLDTLGSGTRLVEDHRMSAAAFP